LETGIAALYVCVVALVMTTIIHLLKLLFMRLVKIKMARSSSKSLEMTTEFGEAAAGGRLIRSAFFKLVKNLGDPHATARLTAKMLKVVQGDTIHDWGKRTVADGDLTFLEGFDFSISKQLERMLPVSIDADIDRKSGQCIVHIPDFIPEMSMSIQGNPTHISFFAAAAEVNFDRESFVLDIVKSEFFSFKKPAGATLKALLPKASKNPLLLAVGFQFYRVVNGKAYATGSREVSSLCIVKVENAPKPSKRPKAIK
jgi:hypothetical protein